MELKFPAVERFEVWEVRDGELHSRLPRMASYYRENAEEMAEHYQTEADERYEIESRGPVKPGPKPQFVVVSLIEQRKVLT